MTELKHSRTHDHGFAIVHVDTFHDMSGTTDFGDVIKVKAVMNTAERAQAEVERLNAPNRGKGSVYFWQVTRLERS